MTHELMTAQKRRVQELRVIAYRQLWRTLRNVLVEVRGGAVARKRHPGNTL